MKELEKAESRRIHNYIDRVLWEVWDPIGVNNAPEARGEYSSYVSRVYELLIAARPDTEIADYLNEVPESAMGLGRNATVPATIAALRTLDLS